MIYSIRHFLGSKQEKNVGEVVIRFMEDHHTDAALLKYLENTPEDKRVVIDMREADIEEHLEALGHITEVHKDTTVMLNAGNQLEEASLLYENQVPYYFDTMVDNWSELTSLVNAHVTDIIISGDLGFDLVDASTLCHEHNIKVRVSPNIAQRCNQIDNLEGIFSFWIRPEDLVLMDDYIDIVEFRGPLDKQDVYIKIYRAHQWLGELSDLIIGMNTHNIFSDRLLPHWGYTRLSCGKRCLKGRCDLCSSQVRFARALKDKADFRIKITDDKPKVIEFDEYKKELAEHTLPGIDEDFTKV